MKYNIRFFIQGKHKKHAHIDTSCIADIKSSHIPSNGDFIYLDENVLHEKYFYEYNAVIFRVLYSVKIFGSNGITSVEVVLKRTNI